MFRGKHAQNPINIHCFIVLFYSFSCKFTFLFLTNNDYVIVRVLIVDWDIHHGNGTQHLFESDPRYGSAATDRLIQCIAKTKQNKKL